MKTTNTLNTLIISMLLAVAAVFPVSAADLDRHTDEMNRVLQQMIEQKMGEDLRLAGKARVQIIELYSSVKVVEKNPGNSVGAAS